MASQGVTQVSDSDFDTVVLSSSVPVMVEFFAPWCPHCRRMAPIIEAVARDYAGRVNVVQVNVEGNVQAAGRYQVSGVPTMVFFVNGQPVDRLVGEVSQQALAERLDRVVVAQPQPR